MLRWRLLLACAIVTGLGFAATARAYGRSLFDDMWLLEIGGIVVVLAVSLYASIRNVRTRWPAYAAIAGSLPMALRVLQGLSHGAHVLDLDWNLQLILFGTIATVATAVISAMKVIPPPPDDDPIPPARVVD